MAHANSDFSQPRISSYAAARELSARMLRNIVQSLIWSDGRGLTEEFSADASGAEIRIVKHNPVKGDPRTLGELGDENNDHVRGFDQYTTPSTSEYGIRPVHVYDITHEIATTLEEMIPLNVINAESANMEKRIRNLINGFTLATKFAAAFNHAKETGDESRFIDIDIASDEVLPKIQDAHALLDEGDSDNGIDVFPMERIAVFSPEGKNAFMRTDQGVLNLNNSQVMRMVEIGSGGATASESQLNTQITGYFGDFYNSPQHMASREIFKVAEEWLGSDGDGKILDNVVAVVSATEGTGRVIGMPRRQKIQDSVRGHGLAIQPLVRWGAEVFYPKAEVFVVKSLPDFTGPELKVIGKASRS